MKRLLWIGDAACGSGFGRATHHILEELRGEWDISVLGVNYRGDPHNEPYPIYPAWIGGDAIGMSRVAELVPRIQPHLVVMQTNPWNVPRYMKSIPEGLPAVGIVAVEGKNCRGDHLNQLSKAIFWTEFGRHEAHKGGMVVPSGVVPLGVDCSLFTPGDKREARAFTGLPDRCLDAFIVGNVNRNQNRKRLDLSIQFFAEWWYNAGRPDAYLYLHVLPGSSTRVDCAQLSSYYGLGDTAETTRLILAEPKDIFHGVPDEYMVATYRGFDVQWNTGLGEGWGLTTMEGMACGVPQIAGNYAALAEWGDGSVYLVPVSTEGVMPDVNNMIGAEPQKGPMVRALDTLFKSPTLRKEWAGVGLQCVRQAKYSWANIGQRFAKEILCA